MTMWTLAIKNKISAALLLCVAIGLVLLTNFGEHSNSKKIGTAITSMYEDRMVVEGYIFDLSRHLDNMHHIYIKAGDAERLDNESTAAIDKHVAAIHDINARYAKTKLTAEEKYRFEVFSKICAGMAGASSPDPQHYAELNKAKSLLNELSEIQLKEARLQMDSVTSLSSFSSLISQFEMAVLIVIAIMIQALVLSSKIGKSLTAAKNIGLN